MQLRLPYIQQSKMKALEKKLFFKQDLFFFCYKQKIIYLQDIKKKYTRQFSVNSIMSALFSFVLEPLLNSGVLQNLSVLPSKWNKNDSNLKKLTIYSKGKSNF